MGLQERVSEESLCYEDLTLFITYVWNAGYALDYSQYITSADGKGKTPTDMGFVTQLQEFGVDVSLLGFNCFTSCYMANLLMLIGTFTTNVSGAMNYTTTIYYEYMSYSAGSDDSLIIAVERAMVGYYPSIAACAEHIAYYMAQTLSNIFEFSIPVYQVNEYEMES